MSKKTEQQVIQQDLALDSYLQTLLAEIPSEEAPVELKVKEKPALDLKKSVVKKTQPKSSQVDVKPKEIIEVQAQAEEKPLELAELVAAQQSLAVMPDWAQQEFHALFFKVDQLILATPLTELLRMVKLTHQRPTSIPGQPSWFIGLLDDHENRIGLLDTGQLIQGKKEAPCKKPESVLITADGKWGLACDGIISINKLKPEAVRWRTQRDKRPWLIGTVIDELTAVVDVRQLVPHRKAGS